MTVRSALARGQRKALKLMQETCTVGRTTRGPLNANTDTYSDVTTTVYSGMCHVKPMSVASLSEAGQVAVAIRRYTVSLPAGTSGIERGDVVTVTASGDSGLVGRPLTVIDLDLGQLVTAKRLTVEDRS